MAIFSDLGGFYSDFYGNQFEQDKKIIMKIISSIFKNTLQILEKSYNKINVPNFNKPLKQIYINLFYSFLSISKKLYISETLINYFFNIIKYYHNYITNITTNTIKKNQIIFLILLIQKKEK